MGILCRCLRVSRSAYYAWAVRKKRPPDERRAAEAKAVKDYFYYQRRRYGTRRMSEGLKGRGIEMGRCKVRRVMKEERLAAINPKRFVPQTTDSRHDKKISPNLLKEAEETGGHFGVGMKIVGDITYLPVVNGKFCYLAMFQDRVTKRIVGWNIAARMTAALVTEALGRGLRQGLIRKGAIVHTDRGSQYASNEYRRLVARCSLRQSMSGKGNCYDNAQAESFFSRFKTELVERGIFETVQEARAETFSYIEGYYNRTRLHSTIGYKSPIQFEQELKLNQRRSKKVSFLSS